jgi:uncharacterized zinc-type alcohol dehydrogenase-like protein
MSVVLHIVGAAPQVNVNLFPLNAGEKSIGASPDRWSCWDPDEAWFCNRHGIEPITEEFQLSRVNEALAHLESGEARYRIKLQNDLD